MTFRVNTHYPAHMDYTKTNPIEQQRTHGSHSLLYQIPAVPSRSKAHLQSIRSEKEKRIRPLNLLALMHFKGWWRTEDFSNPHFSFVIIRFSRRIVSLANIETVCPGSRELYQIQINRKRARFSPQDRSYNFSNDLLLLSCAMHETTSDRIQGLSELLIAK